MAVVAFQGERGAFSEGALRSRFGPEAEPLPCPAFADVFAVMGERRADFAVLPVENSQAGGVAEVHDLMLRHPLVVIGEVLHPVDLCLMALPGQEPSDLQRVMSHPVALAQCGEYLRGLGVEVVAVYDTAGSAKMVRDQGLRGVGAVADASAAAIYGLDVLVRRIQTVKDNTTRFIVAAHEEAPRAPGPQKTMAVATVRHEPGGLLRVLAPMSRHGVNLLRLEPRPSRVRPWEYVFFMDLAGHAGDPPVAAALAEAARCSVAFRVLGSFAVDERVFP